MAFEAAADAVACTVAAHRALAGHNWQDGAVVRVRMGLHLGQPTPYENGYVGMDVHRGGADRGDGGRRPGGPVGGYPDPGGSRLPAGVSVRDLGLHRLKDMAEPERNLQLTGPGLQEDFPPLKSLGTMGNLVFGAR